MAHEPEEEDVELANGVPEEDRPEGVEVTGAETSGLDGRFVAHASLDESVDPAAGATGIAAAAAAAAAVGGAEVDDKIGGPNLPASKVCDPQSYL